MKSAIFTGHRNAINIENAINALIDIAIKQGINHFYSGMALGTDMIASKVLINRKLPWTAVIPFNGQESGWVKSSQVHYFELLSYAKEQIILYPEYKLSSYHERNQYMIDHSKVCLAVYDERRKGGTANVVKKVKKLEMNLAIYNPSRGVITKFSKAN
jgi:uncharacterized phage-like protein YoqJ